MPYVKKIIKQCLIFMYGSLPAFIRKIFKKNKYTILIYHEISPNKFSQHITYLKENYNLISFEKVKEVIYGETEDVLPENSLVITIDDGWKSNYKLLDVIKEARVPVTIFLTVGLIGTNRKIWNYTIDRRGKDAELNRNLKLMDNKKKNQILKELNGYFPEKEYTERSFLSLEEIRNMSDYVDFQSHGMYHPVYPMCDDEELMHEMEEAKNRLFNMLGKNSYAIAYPYGRHGKKETDYAKKVGYKVARTASDPGLNTLDSDPFRLKGIGVSSEDDVLDLSRKILWVELMDYIRK